MAAAVQHSTVTVTQGAHIRALLEGRGWSIAQLARETGIARESLSRIINDREGLGPERGEKVAAVLGLPLEDVLLERPTLFSGLSEAARAGIAC